MPPPATLTTAHLKPPATRTELASPPLLWSNLEPTKKRQLAQLLATLISRQRTPPPPTGEVKNDEQS